MQEKRWTFNKKDYARVHNGNDCPCLLSYYLNILFSALISGRETYLDIVKANDVYVPDFVLYELNKYETRIITKAKLKQADFRLFVRMLFEKIVVIPKFAISPESWREAYKGLRIYHYTVCLHT